ncbi:MAG: O-antigen ligase family protein [Actinobacteria bacterium]|nr:O-antigen ligase family protein [Actinomycetota bacterium]
MATIATVTVVLAFTALHHGSYSITDRQQLAVLVWAVIGTAAIVGMLPRVRPARALWLPYAALAATAVWIAIGLKWTESDEKTFNEAVRVVGYLGVMTLTWLTVSRENWRRIAPALPAAAVLVCALAMASRFWPALFPADAVAKNLGAKRLNYPFGYWNAMGCWAAMSVTLCLAWAAHARGGVVRALALAAVPICVLVLYCTISRAALGGVILGPAVVIALGRNHWLTAMLTLAAGTLSAAVVMVARRHESLVQGLSTKGAGGVIAALAVACAACAVIAWTAHRLNAGERLRMNPRTGRRAALAGAVVALVLAVIVVPPAARHAWDDFQQTTFVPTPTQSNPDARLTNLSGNRINVWESAWRAAREHPVKGIGAGTFEVWWNRDGENGEFLKDAHSIYLEAWAETGVVGFALMLLFLGGLAWAAWRGRRALGPSGETGIHAGLCGVFAVFLLQAGADWIWESTAVTVLGLVAVGLAGGAGSERLIGAGGTDDAATSASASVAVVLVAVIAIVLQLPGLSSEVNLKASRKAAIAGNYAKAAARATDAIEAMPWGAGGYGQRGLVEEQRDQIQPAITDLNQAIESEPTNWRWWLLSARALVQKGDASGAAQALEMAGEYRVHGRLTD